MGEKRTKALKPAVLFGKETVKKVGYIEDYIFACERAETTSDTHARAAPDTTLS